MDAPSRYDALGNASLNIFYLLLSICNQWCVHSGAALTIESETWKFRTRSGIYVENGGDKAISDDSNNDNILKNRSESIKLHVLKSAGVLNTYFM